jgi:hypothetical protein
MCGSTPLAVKKRPGRVHRYNLTNWQYQTDRGAKRLLGYLKMMQYVHRQSLHDSNASTNKSGKEYVF